MKLELNESQFFLELTLSPETVEEFAQLLRYTQNAAAIKPEVFLSFRDSPYCLYFPSQEKTICSKKFN